MGAWGHGGFDNDDALDFVAELAAGETWGPAAAALASVIEVGRDYLEAPAASKALAAAEVISAAAGRPSPRLPSEVAAWVARTTAPGRGMIETAHGAVERVLKDSELRDLWSASPKASMWQREVEELLARLHLADVWPPDADGSDQPPLR